MIVLLIVVICIYSVSQYLSLELDCGEPAVDYLHSVDIYGNTLYDKTLHICVDGYEHSEGLSTTMCTDESQWEVVHPICLGNTVICCYICYIVIVNIFLKPKSFEDGM